MAQKGNWENVSAVTNLPESLKYASLVDGGVTVTWNIYRHKAPLHNYVHGSGPPSDLQVKKT